MSDTVTRMLHVETKLPLLVAMHVTFVVVNTLKRALALLQARLRMPEPSVVFTVGKKFTMGFGMPSEACNV